ncbi:MAG: energy transducer TonB [Nitrospirota bacterium]
MLGQCLRRHRRPEIIEQKQESEKPERKLSPVIPDSQASDTQAPVQAPAEQKNEGASHASNITAENKTALIRTGSNESVNLIDGTVRYLKENFSYVRDAIQKKISYPRVARQMGWEGKVVVSFIVCADGHAKDIKIKEGSGIALLDRNAIETVKKASPFPRPPVEAQLLIPIKYSLN